jgi:hypothetical protein
MIDSKINFVASKLSEDKEAEENNHKNNKKYKHTYLNTKPWKESTEVWVEKMDGSEHNVEMNFEMTFINSIFDPKEIGEKTNPVI